MPGKISLDDSITKYFPDAPDTWKPILIKNLLSHTSGLSEYETPERRNWRAITHQSANRKTTSADAVSAHWNPRWAQTREVGSLRSRRRKCRDYTLRTSQSKGK
jgi:CubicO group peptidase (beta-lactamase class C family)